MIDQELVRKARQTSLVAYLMSRGEQLKRVGQNQYLPDKLRSLSEDKIRELNCWNWSFLGFPKHSVIAFSDIGSYQNKKDRKVLFAQYEEMIKRLEPIQVLYFTRESKNVPNECVPIIISYFEGKK